MKKSFLYLFTVLCTLNMFTACSDDDSKDPNGLEVNATYSGENLDLKDYPLLVEYLGLEKELEDGILYYQEELLKSETFRYKLFLEEGNFSDNITL